MRVLALLQLATWTSFCVGLCPRGRWQELDGACFLITTGQLGSDVCRWEHPNARRVSDRAAGFGALAARLMAASADAEPQSSRADRRAPHTDGSSRAPRAWRGRDLPAICRVEAGSCPNGWSEHDNMCYWCSNLTTTVYGYDLREFCNNLAHVDSVPASSHSEEADEFLSGLLPAHPATAAWLGLHRLAGEEPWHWWDGSAFNHSAWQQQPSDSYDCVALHRGSPGWSPVSCYFPRPFLCQLPLQFGTE